MTGDPLVNELAARVIGPGYTRMQAQLHPSLEKDRWAALEHALALLPEATRDTMPNVAIETGVRPPPFSPVTQGYVDHRDPHTIVLRGDTDMHNKARTGDDEALKHLASLLMHERYHVEHPQDSEAPAYDTQIAELRRLGASKKKIAEIVAARDFVAAQPR